MAIAAAPEPKNNMGRPEPRIDGRAKVTGQARYASDFPAANPLHAYLVTSSIAKGRIRSIDLTAAREIAGVVDIVTHENAERAEKIEFFGKGGSASTEILALASDRIWHEGQIVAMVLADRYETAREAAHKVRVAYDAEPPTATLESPGTTTKDAADLGSKHKDPKAGDYAAALAASAVKIEADYRTPAQHHNPIELFATTCVWNGDELTIHEPSQWVYGLKLGIAKQLRHDPAKVHVVSPFVGGAFGSKGGITQRTVLVAQAARRLGRPVKLVMPRDQGFSLATYRAETRHKVTLGADRSGKITAYGHEAWELTSRSDAYFNGGTGNTSAMYAVPNVETKVRVVDADRNTPGFMRSPAEVPYMYALESAMDELAVKLNIDPVELRRINDTDTNLVTGARYTSRSLMKCYDEASAAFGWSKRTPEPRSMRDGDWLIGWGCATATYPTQHNPAAARVRLTADGAVRVQVGAHDVGTGAYTVIAQTAAEQLGVPLAKVDVELGDSELPPAPVAGGSVTTASVCSVIMLACQAIRDRLSGSKSTGERPSLAISGGNGFRLERGRLIGPDGQSEELAKAFERIGVGAIEEYAEWQQRDAKPGSLKQLYAGGVGITGGALPDRTMFAFGAEFVEVRIHALTREIRVPRITGAFAAGRIVNTRTARSQYLGGLVWGISSALHEATEIDEREARYVNDNIAEYLIPVNADIGEVEIIMVPEVDNDVNPAGIKGIGELSNVGTAAAIANAVYHATGKRVRELPIRIEKLL